jgi:hypothetical protein
MILCEASDAEFSWQLHHAIGVGDASHKLIDFWQRSRFNSAIRPF